MIIKYITEKDIKEFEEALADMKLEIDEQNLLHIDTEFGTMKVKGELYYWARLICEGGE